MTVKCVRCYSEKSIYYFILFMCSVRFCLAPEYIVRLKSMYAFLLIRPQPSHVNYIFHVVCCKNDYNVI